MTSPRRFVDTALIGAGRLAGALATLLPEAGYRIVAVAARTRASARRLVRRASLDARVSDPLGAAGRARVVLLAVPDDVIADLAHALADGLGGEARSRTFLHHAGRLGPEVLEPLERLGARVGVLHPLQTLGDPAAAARVLPGSAARVEGRGEGLRTTRRLARDLGLKPLRLGRAPSRRDRELYHAAASVAANDLLGLLDLAVDAMVRAGLDRRQSVDAVLVLMQGALVNARTVGPARALTGPVVRGDREALSAHLRRLGAVSRDAERVHRLLSGRLAGLAARTGRLDPARARALRRWLLRGAGPAGKARV